TMYRYTRYADCFDAAAMAALFTEDCVCDFFAGREPDKVTRDRQGLHDFLAEAMSQSVSSNHYISNVEIVFESADAAMFYAYMYSWQRFTGYPQMADCHRYGRYEMRAVRAGDGWRFSDLVLLSAGEYGGARIAEQIGRPWPPVFQRVAEPA
ncbi:MAG: hypothetical protein GC201_11065, partial [Alphaproteobacteria bacterium]|nr:hypothetical protein [Alphaproteobacteria bacterium]